MARTTRSKQFTKRHQKESAWRHLFAKYRFRAKHKNYPFELTLEEFYRLATSRCYLCNSLPSNSYRRTSEDKFTLKYQGIDRIDNNKGYTIENSRPCCGKCNAMKSTSSVKEFKKQVTRIAINQSRLKFGVKK